jgi:hypothetical protein
MKAPILASFALAALLAADSRALPAQAAQAAPAPPPGGSLCRARETRLFECSTGRKTISVCGGGLARGGTYAQYRYGRPGRLELEYPARPVHAPGLLSQASVGYSGGGESQIRFVNRGVEYVVYSRTIRTAFGPDGHHAPISEDGVFMRRNGKLLSDRRCLDPPSMPVQGSETPKYMKAGAIVYPE